MDVAAEREEGRGVEEEREEDEAKVSDESSVPDEFDLAKVKMRTMGVVRARAEQPELVDDHLLPSNGAAATTRAPRTPTKAATATTTTATTTTTTTTTATATDTVKCPVCLDVLALPVSTSCGHNACRSCTALLVLGTTGDRGTLKCAVCRRFLHVPSIRRFAVNAQLSQLIQHVVGMEAYAKREAAVARDFAETMAKLTGYGPEAGLGGEFGGAHDRGWETLRSEEFDLDRGKLVRGERSHVRVADDYVMQVALALVVDPDPLPPGVLTWPSAFASQRFRTPPRPFGSKPPAWRVSVAMLQMEEDEVCDSGFPRGLDRIHDPDSNALVRGSFEGTVELSVVCFASRDACAETVTVQTSVVAVDGIASFDLNANEALVMLGSSSSSTGSVRTGRAPASPVGTTQPARVELRFRDPESTAFLTVAFAYPLEEEEGSGAVRTLKWRTSCTGGVGAVRRAELGEEDLEVVDGESLNGGSEESEEDDEDDDGADMEGFIVDDDDEVEMEEDGVDGVGVGGSGSDEEEEEEEAEEEETPVRKRRRRREEKPQKARKRMVMVVGSDDDEDEDDDADEDEDEEEEEEEEREERPRKASTTTTAARKAARKASDSEEDEYDDEADAFAPRKTHAPVSQPSSKLKTQVPVSESEEEDEFD